MGTSAEYIFTAAVQKAEGTRQTAKAAAFSTWAFQQGAPLTTYATALEAADNAFITAVNAAASTAGVVGGLPPGLNGPAGAAALANVVLGNMGMSAISPQLSPNWASYGATPLP